MEKIQAAIEKARASRAGMQAAPAQASAPAPEPVAPQPAVETGKVDAAWAALAGFIPDPRLLARHRVVTLGGGREATPFDVMRTKVLQQMRANGWKRLAITSPTAKCGKSTIALNLGFSLSRQADLRTVIAELDLRRPSLAATLGLNVPHSFARVLEGQVDFADQAVKHSHNLAIAVNQGAYRNPAELMHSAALSGILADIEARYAPDIMIFDMPPMLVSDDTMAFMGNVDCALLVAAAEATTIKEIDLCERELASQTNVMGVVLNKCRYMGPEYGYSYYS